MSDYMVKSETCGNIAMTALFAGLLIGFIAGCTVRGHTEMLSAIEAGAGHYKCAADGKLTWEWTPTAKVEKLP